MRFLRYGRPPGGGLGAPPEGRADQAPQGVMACFSAL